MTDEKTQEWREQMGARILEQCDLAASALGARGIVMIALFPDEDGGVHCVDAGRAPWSLEETYQRMAMAHHLNEITTRGTVQ